MKQTELNALLEHFLSTWENEVIEFKQAGNDYKTDKIGQYFSALANEASLRNMESAWLVFGVDNKSREVCGTDYRPEQERLQGTKMQVAGDTEPSITFRDIHELQHLDGRVVMFEVPAAPRGMPIAWKGHYYARAGESLTSLSLDKLDEIRRQTLQEDWSVQIVSRATNDDLDDAAIGKARAAYAQKYANRHSEEEIMSWPLETFLERAKLTDKGRLTRAAILLLGKEEATDLLSPHLAQITWKLMEEDQAYQHFSIPFVLTTDALYQKIRNFQVRVLPEDQLLAVEVPKYDQRIVLETLHNCVAHQDYSRNGRITVTEFPDKLIFGNVGGFFGGRPEDYILGTKIPSEYRNPFLARAMTELNMIDTIGHGIHSIHVRQARRFFPMPDFDLSEQEAVKVTIHGRILDEAYSQILIKHTDLPLNEILALDRVQKHLPLPDDMIKQLRQKGFVEGRKPNLRIAASVARAADEKADGIQTRTGTYTQDDDHYCKLITDYLARHGKASRKDIDRLLTDKLSGSLDSAQKSRKIENLLTRLRRQGAIVNGGSRKDSLWRLAALF